MNTVCGKDTATKNLQSLSNSQLRKIQKKIKKAISGNYDTLGMLQRRTDTAYESNKKCYELIHKTNWILGKRKGRGCPALRTHNEVGQKGKTVTYYSCGAKETSRYNTSYNFFYVCSDCKLSRKQAKEKMVWTGVFHG